MSNGERGNTEASTRFLLRKSIPKNYKLLDIGCNMGSLSAELKKLGYDYTWGIDIDNDAIIIGKERNKEISDRLFPYDGSHIPFEDDFFDAIMSFDVIEHIPDIDRHFQEVKRILKPGGLYHFQTPNKLINVPWQILFDKNLRRWKSYHCSLHTVPGIKKRLSNNGFQLESFDRESLDTKYNRDKIRRRLGAPGIAFIKLFNRAPQVLFPHMWCTAKNLK